MDNKAKMYQLTENQKGLYFDCQVEEVSHYNISIATEVKDDIDIALFERALKILIKKHGVLRTYFTFEDEMPCQVILPEVEFQLDYEDLSAMGEKDQGELLKKISLNNALDTFALDQAPLFRAKLIKVADKHYQFYLCIHHIISDGWSLEIFRKELLETYIRLTKGEEIELQPLEKDFFDFVERENQRLAAGKYEKQKEYWVQKMADAEPLSLITDYPITSRNDREGQEYLFSVAPELYHRLKEASIEEGTTLFMYLFAAFKVLLHKYTGSLDLTVTSPFSNRPGLNYEEVIGYFVNLLPIRDELDPKMTFAEFVKGVKRSIIDAYKNVSYPNNLIFRELKSSNSLESSLLDYTFVFDIYEGEMPEYELDVVEIPQEGLSVPGNLMMLFSGDGQEVFGKIQYNAGLFKESTIARMAEHFTQLLEQLVEGSQVLIEDLLLITDEERELIIHDFNQNETEFPSDLTIHELFERRVVEIPEAVGVVYKELSLTYREVNEKANQLARLLQKQGVQPDSYVGIMVNRSVEMVIGILAILKSGAAYVPIDPEYPADRMEYILNDCGAPILLTTDLSRELNWSGLIFDISLGNEEIYQGETENLGKTSTATNLSYLIYTSGSTGKPKGVMIQHQGVVNILAGLESLYPLAESDGYLLKTTYTFDVSVAELFGWFTGRGKLVILESGAEKDPTQILSTIQRYHVTHINFVPSMFRMFLQLFDQSDRIKDLASLKYIFVAGEAVTPDLIDKFYRLGTDIEFVNIYGPTEATIYGSYYPLKYFREGVNVPIGRPVPNYKNYIVDAKMNLLPVGVPGELCLSGVGLARGYVHQDDLTHDKFLPNPFVDASAPSYYQRMYRTGDLARWLPDGNIEYLGRIDFQVKIRGFRIELGEIENVILEDPLVTETVVTAKEDQYGSKYLCAYYTAEGTISDSKMRDHLAKSVPDYMIPSHFIPMDEMPHTSSGKIDRKRLPMPGEFTRKVTSTYIAPKSAIEKTIAKIWKEVLNIDQVGMNDSFFELGGHSLSLLQVNKRLKSELDVDITITKLFQYPTIRALVDFIKSMHQVEEEEVYASVQDDEIDTDIAVVGMSGRFPGAKSVQEFWKNLKEGKETIRHFTDEELLEAGISKEDLEDPNYVKAKGILDDIEYFDPAVFDYSPKEVEVMDPQFRMLYQVAHEALEHAGYDPEIYKGLIGFFAGCSDNFNWTTKLLFNDANMGDKYSAFTLTANNFLSTRISYKLNLKGPSFTAQTGCSTSLVTIHLACQSLIRKECDMALAGGVTIELPAQTGYHYYEGMMFSPDGHCRPFDDQARGTVFSDGLGLVVLKRLKDAIRDGDHIHAVVKASVINNDGSSKVAYTAPSIEGQSAAIKAAYRRAGFHPETVGYIETHGTGTSMGDPIEVESLKLAFNTNKKQFCYLGSAKGHIGHMDIAAGVGGFIKTVLSLEYGEIPPILNLKKPNSKIDFVNSPFAVNTKLVKWENPDGRPRRAGINAFGVGGTNAHIVLEQPPKTEPSSAGRDWKMLLISANTRSALENNTVNLAQYLTNHPTANLADVAYTLQVGRKAFKYRKMVVCRDIEEAVTQLTSAEQQIYMVKDGQPVYFIFTGQGAEYVNMGRQLYEQEEFFTKSVQECLALLPEELSKELVSTYYPEAEVLTGRPELADLISFISQYALAQLLMNWGVTPTAMIGQGLGEYVAACVAGVITLHDAINLVRLRSQANDLEATLAEKLAHMKIKIPKIPYISTATGMWITEEELSQVSYWSLANANQLEKGFSELLLGEASCFIQLGAGSILADLTEKYIAEMDNCVTLHTLRDADAEVLDYQFLFENLGRLWCIGISLDWDKFHAGQRRLRVALPTYAFDKHYFSIDTIDPEQLLAGGAVDLSELQSQKPVTLYQREITEDYVAPRNELEEAVIQAFQNVLGMANISIHEDFFELGGDSLKAVSLGSELYKSLNVKVELTELFQRPTPAELAEFLKDHTSSEIFAPIERVGKKDYYPLSSAQKRMYALYQLDERSLAYNLPSATVVEGEIDLERFKEAFQKLVQRHESLRTSFEIVDGEPVQIIHDQVEMDIKYREVQIAEDAEIDQLAQEFMQPYDLAQAPLFRVEIVKIGEKRHVLLFDLHHIVADGTSGEIISRDGCQLYFDDLPELPIQYKDFAVWQNDLMKSEMMKEQKEYWLERFSGELPILDLPTDYPRPAVKSFEGDKVYFEIPEEYTVKLKELASENGATLYMTLMSLYYVLLHKYTGQEDIIIGSPNAGRRHPDLEDQVGMFVNTLAMRNYPTGEGTFVQFLGEVKDNTLKAFENQDYQFDDLVEQLDLARDISRNPLFDTEFDLQNMEFHEMEVEDLSFIPYQITNKTSQFDIALECEEHDNKLNAIFEYCERLFKRETIERMAGHYLELIKAVLDNPQIKLAEINLNTEAEKNEILYTFNTTEREYEMDLTIAELFERQAERVPEGVAVIFDDLSLTYHELNARANQLAHLLREKGVSQETIVGLMTTRSLEMIIGMLGVLKAGGAYMPLDPDFPLDRIQYMIEDSEVEIILSQQDLELELEFSGDTIHLDDLAIYTGADTNLEKINDSKDMAYMIYTSGSTGNPKGVMVPHRTVHNFINGVTDLIDFTGEKKILSVTTFSFDIFVLESLLPLAVGITTVIATEEEQKDPLKLNEVVCKYQIDMIQTTPSRMKTILEDEGCVDALNTLNCIMVGGEEFPLPLLKELQMKTSARIYNMYGPTEATVWSTIQDLTELDQISIGVPIANTQIYILNENLKPQPMGVYGELCIAGDGVANGYFKRPELTAEKFIANPFMENSRMYKTGDLGRWLPNGDLEVKGRIDYQVKIRGYRIELGEIEHLLLEHSDLNSTCVVKKTDQGGNAYLCAYYVLEDGVTEAISGSDLREFLAHKLPVYMIPSFFIQIDEMPLTPNGKINRKALPAPEKFTKKKATFVAPNSDMEKMIAEIWKDVLGIENVGLKDNFFEIGGHSMGLIQVTSRLRKLASKDIPVVTMFQYPTIEAMARFFESENFNFNKTVKTKSKVAKTRGDIAIIGMAGRFPGASSVDEYWEIIQNGQETITFFTDEELIESGVDPSLLMDPNYIRAKGHLEDVEYFDAGFFDYSPKEADMMDPQLRLLHQITWETLENASYNPDDYDGAIGLFAGSATNTAWLTRFFGQGGNFLAAYEAGTLNEKDFVSTRISYKLNLKGPSFTVQTACSTSLVTIHLACQSLLKGECDMALAGGVTVTLPRKEGYIYQEGMIFSKDGHCRPFDANASGTIFGSGVGMVALKRLEDAIEDGDYIHAVVKGSAINNDGVRKIGFTAPSIEGQAEAIRAAYDMAAVSTETVGYIETHGTGTSLGDPIEIEALKMAFETNKSQYCGLGSVKANIGHLDIAAGVAGFIKTVLCLKNKKLPPLVNFTTPNPKIDFEKSPFYVNTQLRDWKAEDHPLRAGVSSFGIGGTNCHIVLEEAQERRNHSNEE